MNPMHALLRAVTILGVSLVALTETLSAFGMIGRTTLAISWLALISVGILAFWRHVRLRFRRPAVDVVIVICVAGITAILLLTAITAAFSPPNSADAMAYHMPRVVYWAEQGSVRVFPTQYLNQVMLQPMAEYFMLHLFVLSQGDRLVNFVQWFASAISIIGVAAIAALMGFGARGQAIAALFCATLPAGVLASSGAKNDYVLAMWLIAAVYFALRLSSSAAASDALFFGAAVGCALLTKGTAYLFAPWPIALILLPGWRVQKWRAIVIALGCALAINAPHYFLNYKLSGSILGFDSAQGDGVYRWRNETFGWKQATSNVLRNLSQQLGARSESWNERLYRTVVSAHSALGIDVNDPATTWPHARFAAPKNANHEADAPNRWHLAMLMLCGCVLGATASRRRNWLPFSYALALICGFVAFCFYLKWQPFMARLFLPLFVLAAPIAAVAGDVKSSVPAALAQVALCLFLLDNAKLAVLENWVRPLRGPSSVFHTARNDQYFADLRPWNNRESYVKTVDELARGNCSTVGLDITNLQLEYPLMALLRERQSGVAFVHTGVQNTSSHYPQPVAAEPCAVVCLDCVGDANRLEFYRSFARSVPVDRFVVLWK